MTKPPPSPTSKPQDVRVLELQTFLDVASTGPQRKLRELRGLSQAEISRHISQVKAYFGDDVFMRVGTGAALTKRGELVRAHVSRALELLAQAKNLRATDEIRIGFTPSSRRLVTAAILKCNKQTRGTLAPPIEFSVHETSGVEGRAKLVVRELSLAIAFDLGFDDRTTGERITDHSLAEFEMKLALPSAVARARPKTWPLRKRLEGLRRCFIVQPTVPPRETKLHPKIVRWLHDQGIDDPNSVACVTAGEALTLIGSGSRYYSVLPEFTQPRRELDVKFEVAPGLNLKTSLHAYCWADNVERLEPLLAALKDVLASRVYELDDLASRVGPHEQLAKRPRRRGGPTRR